ncbi:MAG: septum formation initiator family protein [Clostridia bacterium]|nr:septum formation initiator family protein [Clostridia bacterium]
MSKKTKTTKKSLIILVIPLVVLVYFCVTFVQQQITISQLSDREKSIRTEIQAQEELKKEIDKEMQPENELKRVEKIARDKLGFLKKNERLFVDSSR